MNNDENYGFIINESFDDDEKSDNYGENTEQYNENTENAERTDMPSNAWDESDFEISSTSAPREKDPSEISSSSRGRGEDSFVGLSSYSDISSRSTEPKRKKRGFGAWWKALSKGKKALIITCASLFVLLCALLVIIWPFLNYNYKEISEKPEDLGFEEVIDDRIVNIALFGIDTRDKTSFKGNSDSMMIMSLNTKTKKVKIISLMRDTFVPIESNGKTIYGKLNSAYGGGGAERGIKTINQVFGLDIKEYAAINFFGMVDIIDAVGGIDATITEDELEWKGSDNPNLNGCMQEICAALKLNFNNYYIKTPGEQHLNGVQAVAYSRVRHCKNTWGTNNDYGRTDRQRYVMQQLFTKATTLPKSEYLGLIKALIPCTETSLSINDISSLAFSILLNNPTFEQCRIPQENFLMPFRGSSKYGSVVYFDLDYAKRAIHSIIYEDQTLEGFIAANPIEQNDWFSGGGSGGGSGGNGGGTTGGGTTGGGTAGGGVSGGTTGGGTTGGGTSGTDESSSQSSSSKEESSSSEESKTSSESSSSESKDDKKDDDSSGQTVSPN